MYRTHTCGELRISNVGQEVTLAGWVQRVRKMGSLNFIDLRDRYGITQLVADEHNKEVNDLVEKMGREWVIQAKGTVIERQGGSNRETFTVRNSSNGIGVEKTWPLHSPNVEKIEVVRRGKVRRAKLFYLRDRVGKKAKVKELVK